MADVSADTRRRLGLRMLAAGVVLAGLQGFFEWVLPYDPMALQVLGDLLGLPALDPSLAALAWAALALVALVILGEPRARGTGALRPAWALLVGALLGLSRLAAGGAAPALALLVLAGVATLGWQGLRHGGLPMLLAMAASIAGCDALASDYATLWPFCAMLLLLFVWIEQRHVQAAERRLIAALAERERLINELDARGAELQRLQAARTQMLAGISHDLRQPLQAVRLYADALRPRLDDAGQSLLAHQMKAAADAVDMLDQFSEFGAIEQGRLRSQEELLDLREVVRGVAASLRATHAAQGVRIGEHGRSQWVRSDRSQITRIVQNLAGNAVKHARAARGEAGVRVSIGLRELRGDLAIDVVDNGPGIATEAQASIFEPYVQLASGAGAKGGRGLGLAIVRALVQQLGLGLAPLRSTLGRGTRFRVVVPAALRIAAPEVPATERRVAATAGLADRLFAVLDDDDAPRQALAAALQAAGARCVSAADVRALRDALDQELGFPDALLFDLDLGQGMDGLQAVQSLREEWSEEIPAVIVTGRVGVGQGLLLPPRCVVLAKPTGIGELAAALAPMLPPRAAAGH